MIAYIERYKGFDLWQHSENVQIVLSDTLEAPKGLAGHRTAGVQTRFAVYQPATYQNMFETVEKAKAYIDQWST